MHSLVIWLPVYRLAQKSRPLWIGGAVVTALDLRLEVAGSIPAAALSSATLDKLFTHIVQRLWCYNLISASEMTYIVSGGALNSTHSLTHPLQPYVAI